MYRISVFLIILKDDLETVSSNQLSEETALLLDPKP
jgi:hypothetical protein